MERDPGIRPEAHIWLASQLPWLSDTAETNSFAEFLPGLAGPRGPAG